MTLGNDNGTDGQTDRQTDRRTDRVRRNMRPPPREEGRIKALRETQTLRALAVVRFGHHPPVANTQTGPTTILIHCAAKLSAQCK